MEESIDAVSLAFQGGFVWKHKSQSPDRGVYFRQPNVQDIDSFFAAGRRLVDDVEYSLILERYLPPDVSLGFMPALRKGGERWQISPPA